MSIGNFLGDVFTGNFAHAYKRLQDWYAGLSPEEQAFISRLGTESGTLLKSLATVGITDVAAGGFTTASFVTAGKDIVAKAEAQGQTILLTDAMAQLNILAAPLNPANAVALAPAPVVAAVEPQPATA